MKQQFLLQAEPVGDDVKSLECLVLDGRGEADRAWIESDGGLDEAVKKIVSNPPRHNRRIHLGSSIVLSLVRTEDATDDDLIGLNMLIEANRVVTVCYGTGSVVEDALARHVEHDGPGDVSRLLPVIATALVRPLESEITRLADIIAALEDKAMEESDDGLDDSVVLVGQQVLGLRRYLAPMRDELSFLAFNPDELPGIAESKYLRRTAEYLGRLVGTLDSSHQRVTLILNQLRNRDEGRLARSMHKLTMVATVFLPLTFITGLLGINVAGIPDAHDPLAFWLVCVFLLAVAMLAVMLIRWRKWM